MNLPNIDEIKRTLPAETGMTYGTIPCMWNETDELTIVNIGNTYVHFNSNDGNAPDVCLPIEAVTFLRDYLSAVIEANEAQKAAAAS
jgi:hypothetical protein